MCDHCLVDLHAAARLRLNSHSIPSLQIGAASAAPLPCIATMRLDAGNGARPVAATTGDPKDDKLSRDSAAACRAAAAAISLLAELDAAHTAVSARTSELHEQCRAMAAEEARARGIVAKIAKPLSYFESYYVLSTRLGARFEGAEAADAAAAIAAARDAWRAGEPDYPHRVSPDGALLSPATPEFAAALERIDESVAFLAAHPSYSEATSFMTRYRTLQTRAISTVVGAINDAVDRTVAAAAAEVRRVAAAASVGASSPHHGGPTTASSSSDALTALESAEVSQLYVRFRAELAGLRRLTALLESRASAGRRAYADAVRGVHRRYFEARAPIVAEVTATKLRRLVAAPAGAATGGVGSTGAGTSTAPLVSAVRSACAAVARTSLAEQSLFMALFVTPPQPSAADADAPSAAATTSTATMPTVVRAGAEAALAASQEELASDALCDALRPLVLAEASLATLADVTSVLRDEVLGELAAPRGPVLAPFSRAVTVLLRDVQERLIFRANAYISGDGSDGSIVALAKVAATGDPATQTAVSSAAPTVRSYVVAVPLSLADGRAAVLTRVTLHGDADYPMALVAQQLRLRTAASGSGAPRPSPSEAIHPSLVRCLDLLSLLHRALERPSFESLAADAVTECTRALLGAAAAVRGGRGSTGGVAVDATAAARVTLTLVPENGGVAGADTTASSPAPGTMTRGLLSACVTIVGPPRVSGSSVPQPSLASAIADTTALDGDLLLVKSLLLLREQLAPFGLALTFSTRSLDFSSSAAALGAMLLPASGAAPHAAAGATAPHPRILPSHPLHALLSAAGSLLPSVAEVHVDGKLQLEALLKAAAEGFIARARAVLVGGIDACIASAAARRHQHQQQAGSTAAPRPPPAQLYAEAAAALAAAAKYWPAALAALRRRMGLYLNSPITAAILFKPVRGGIASSLAALRSAIAEAEDGVEPAPVADPAADAAGVTRAALESRLAALTALLEASDQLCVDPGSPAFGYDDVVLPHAGGSPMRPVHAQFLDTGAGDGLHAPAPHPPQAYDTSATETAAVMGSVRLSVDGDAADKAGRDSVRI